MTINKVGYGQVEPNHLSAQKTGQINASLPLAADVAVLQNGEFMYYDGVTGTVNATATAIKAGEPMMVFNEIKLYQTSNMTKDFAMIRVGDNYVTSDATTESLELAAGTAITGDTSLGYRLEGFAPRLLRTNVGDIYTTNMVADGDYVVGDTLCPVLNATTKTLVLTADATPEGMTWVVTKAYDLADGQNAVKLQRIA